MTSSRLDAAFDLLAGCQVGEPGALTDTIVEALAEARQAQDSEAESALLYAHIVSLVVTAADGVPELVLAMTRRTLELNQPVWHAIALATSATVGHDSTHVLDRIEALAEAVAILNANATPSRALVRGLNAIAMAYGTDRMWELSEQFFVRTQLMAEHVGDVGMQTGTVINRLNLAANETMDLLRLGYFEQAQDRARHALDVEQQVTPDPEAGQSAILVWTPLALRSVLVHPPEPEADVDAWRSLGADRHRIFALLTAATAVHHDDLERGEELLSLVLAHPFPIGQALASRLATALGAQIAARRVQPALRQGLDSHVSTLSEEIQEIRQVLTATAKAAIASKQQEEETAELRRLSAEDSLTGVANRRTFDALLELRRGKRTALLLIDIDQFKEVNDRFGHEVGDEVLRRIGTAIVTATRERDTVCRIGGDEFAVILASARQSVANRIAARIVAEVDSTQWSSIAAGLSINVSIGVANAQTGEVYGLADKSLYEAKRSHRASA